MRWRRRGLLGGIDSSVVVMVLVVMAMAAGVVRPVSGAVPQFQSGSTGGDGALDFTTTGPITIVFDPASYGPRLDPEADNVYNFTTIHIPADVTLKLSGAVLGSRPVIWLASGDVSIEGTLDLGGENGHGFGEPRRPSAAGAGGYGGGVGEVVNPNQSATPGSGPGGGQSPQGSAGHVVPKSSVAYGNEFLLPLIGGSGGAGGPFYDYNGAGGGGGGGAILIASSTRIALTGSILANGGNTGDYRSYYSSSNAGGGGSGGAIRLMATRIEGNGTLSAAGGASHRDTGSQGRIRVEAYEFAYNGPANPNYLSGIPLQVFPPATSPTLRVISVNGVPVPQYPLGNTLSPDITIDSPTTTTLQIEAHYVPVGAQAAVRLIPAYGGATVDILSQPLIGTLQNSSAPAVVFGLPRGVYRVYAQADWQP